MDNKITIGARGSKLSLAYANKVRSNILSQVPEIDKEIIIKTIKTSGDLFQNKKISEIGGKDLFCKEIEEKLTKKEMKISKLISKDLKKDKIFFAGIDFIDEQLNGDINVTSPTGLKTFYDLSKINLASTFWKELKA